MSLEGWTGTGRKLTEEEIMASVKLHCQSVKKEEDYETLANEVGFNIERAAQQVIRGKAEATQLNIRIIYENSYNERPPNRGASFSSRQRPGGSYRSLISSGAPNVNP